MLNDIQLKVGSDIYSLNFGLQWLQNKYFMFEWEQKNRLVRNRWLPIESEQKTVKTSR